MNVVMISIYIYYIFRTNVPDPSIRQLISNNSRAYTVLLENGEITTRDTSQISYDLLRDYGGRKYPPFFSICVFVFFFFLLFFPGLHSIIYMSCVGVDIHFMI